MSPPESTYVVQQEAGTEEGLQAWTDIATVKVPHRTKRSTVLREALKEAGISPVDGTELTLRVLDADSAEETTVRGKPRDPEWEIG